MELAAATVASAGGPGPMMHPGGVSIAGPHGPLGTTRNPIMVFAISWITCGAGYLYYTWKMATELNAFTQKESVNLIMLFLVVGWFNVPEAVIEAKRVAGIANPTAASAILYVFLWPYFLTNDLNEIWQAAGGGR